MYLYSDIMEFSVMVLIGCVLLLLSIGYYWKVVDGDGNVDLYGICFDYLLLKCMVLYMGVVMVCNGVYVCFVVNGVVGGGVVVVKLGVIVSLFVVGIFMLF